MISGRIIPCQLVVGLCRRFTLGDCKYNNIFLADNKQLFLSKSFESLRLNSTMATGGDSSQLGRNRLALERSPYLLQHATNPVDWYPWCEEAFEKARNENKLIFLSIGYSTCHWCHVMERESFENEEVAEVMNRYFINIKVDREERPDLDKIYMTFVQATVGGGGWPMSVWLTPQLTPIYGGTYYPPTDRYGKPGFKSLLGIINTQWEANRTKFVSNGAEIVKVLKNTSVLDDVGMTPVPSIDCLDNCMQQVSNSYEEMYGGFGQAPKFPQPTILNFLLHVYARSPETGKGKEALDMCNHTLTFMAKGGINDHVSQGFARYSTDLEWHVPHFEKMLYDQGQLAVTYAAAYVATKKPLFAKTTRDILEYVSRDLSHTSGGFYSAEDADSYPTSSSSHKAEGAFCVWTFQELEELLQEPIDGSEHRLADVFGFHYSVKQEGNVNKAKDPHGELEGKNILMMTGSEKLTATKFGLDMEMTQLCLQRGREILFKARQSRPRPHLDDKMVTAWNGLMISGFAKGGSALGDEAFIQRAVRAADFVKEHLYDPTTGTLIRSCYQGSNGNVVQISVPISGFLDDYAFLVRGLLDLYEACFDPIYIEWAESLQDKQNELFWNKGNAGYFTSSATEPNVIVRLVEDQDGAEPSGNSVSVANLERMACLLDRSDFHDLATKILAGFSTRLRKVPLALTEMMSALLLHTDAPTQVIVTGKKSDPDTKILLDVINSKLIPGRVLALADNQTDSILYRKNEVIRRMKPQGGHAAAFICRHHTCSLPVDNIEDLEELLECTRED